MRRLTKNFILTTAVVSAIFFVDPSSAGATSLHENFYRLDTNAAALQYMDFWSKFRDTVTPDPNRPQNNNPPKETRRPRPSPPPDKTPPRSSRTKH